ncbi:MAG: acetyl-CoA C-acetyltransferase [Methanomassiliicoccales archaeon]|nr:acetyl-CoA C-acetyltransferase [Methanomassiliicoccales archaeon]NYT15211.1 acetyl-CoA C-acetyltransferase [Methanomassiliicoccales archaeon]
MKEVVILSAVRTAIGKFGGNLTGMPITKVGAEVVKEAVSRANVEPQAINECLMGQVLPAGVGQNPARQCAIYAGLPDEMGSTTINKVCGSGMKAVMLAANSIKSEEHEVIVAGGMENMSAAPYLMRDVRWGLRMNDGSMVDSMVYDGLWDIFNDVHMGLTGEIVAERYNVTREEADELACQSHMKAKRATDEGSFEEEILPLTIQIKKKEIEHKVDEGIRPDTTMETLARLRPAFKKDGIVTAGNSSQISDGASALVIASREFADSNGIEPLATIVGYATSGTKPEWIMEAPIVTTRKLLDKTGLTIDDIDLFEHNEAFATASVAVKKELNVPEDAFNVNGGAVALGHPIGCSGARVLTTLLYAMKHRKAETGLATLCLGGGNAVSMILRR